MPEEPAEQPPEIVTPEQLVERRAAMDQKRLMRMSENDVYWYAYRMHEELEKLRADLKRERGITDALVRRINEGWRP